MVEHVCNPGYSRGRHRWIMVPDQQGEKLMRQSQKYTGHGDACMSVVPATQETGGVSQSKASLGKRVRITVSQSKASLGKCARLTVKGYPGQM
jgi:hypothetical protein